MYQSNSESRHKAIYCSNNHDYSCTKILKNNTRSIYDAQYSTSFRQLPGEEHTLTIKNSTRLSHK